MCSYGRNVTSIDCDIRPEWTKSNFIFEFLSEHQTEKIDGFNQLEILIVHFDKLKRVNLEFRVNFKKFDLDVNDT